MYRILVANAFPMNDARGTSVCCGAPGRISAADITVVAPAGSGRQSNKGIS